MELLRSTPLLLIRRYHTGARELIKLHHLASLIGRLYLAKVFFSAGLVKIQDWDTTLFLFEEEYQVPLLSPELGAILGTGGELILPILLVLGLATRFSALGLFIVNMVAVMSLVNIPAAALYLHVVWGLIALQLFIYGGGWFSLDQFIKRLIGKRDEAANPTT